MAEDPSRVTEERTIQLRYAGSCRLCGVPIAAGTRAIYSPTGHSVRCLACAPVPAEPATSAQDPEVEVRSGGAGASARRVFEQRKAKREKSIREAHPRLGGLILAASEPPQSTRAWNGGAVGEETLGARLDGIASPTVRILHDRRIPRSRANIDHLVVCPTGVLVVDTKRYVGRRPTLRVDGGMFTPRSERLVVGGRDASSLIDGVQRQVDAVTQALPGFLRETGRVAGVLCFVDADWPLFGGSFEIRGVEVLWPRRLVRLAGAPGPLLEADIERVARRLAAVLRPA